MAYMDSFAYAVLYTYSPTYAHFGSWKKLRNAKIALDVSTDEEFPH